MASSRNVSSRALLLLGLALAPSLAMAQTQTPLTQHGGMTNSNDKMGGMMDNDKMKSGMGMMDNDKMKSGMRDGKPATQLGAASTAGQSAVMLSDHTMRTSRLIGARVFNDQGENVGIVDDIIVTAGPIEPIVVVSIGGFLGGEKLTTEPLSHLKLGQGDKMMMPDATKAILMARPNFSYENGLEGGGG